MEELYSTEGDYGLRTLSEPDEAVVEYDAPLSLHWAFTSDCKAQLYIRHVLACTGTDQMLQHRTVA